MDVKNPLESLSADRKVIEELGEKVCTDEGLERSDKIGADGVERVQAVLENFGKGYERIGADPVAEAIILSNGRPALLVVDGRYENPLLQIWRDRLTPRSELINRAIASVGRIELMRHPEFEWVGTGFLVDNNLAITNRHVAEVFARQDGGSFSFASSPFGGEVGVRLDLLETFNPDGPPPEKELVVEKILFVADRSIGSPDMAVLQIRPHSSLPDSLELADQDPKVGDFVGVIGYPARDSRNGFLDQQRIFNDIFDVKRFAPGQVTAVESTLQHDCTTLGGNSGSAIIDINTGKVVGLHFGGRFMVANFAVPVNTVKSTLQRATPTTISVPDNIPTESLDDRRGYSESFLGNGGFDFEVPLPDLDDERKRDALIVNSSLRGMERFELKYTHFSIVMSQSRRFAVYTAVNIDGNQEVRIQRSRGFRLDPRIGPNEQVGEFLYSRNPLDRGHLVRRLDPVWGSTEEARQAERDSFFFTNVAPQHAQFNQQIWLSLEDYLLTNANNRDLMISVFTGPIFGADDPVHRSIQIPADFWKVVVMVSPAGKLNATGYILSQSRLIDDLEFIFGQFRTFQVPISRIEKETGIQFSDRLRSADPLASIEGLTTRPLSHFEDIVM